MQKVPLHQDGPIEISDTDLQKFLDLRKQSGHGYYFDYLYYDWLCERYPDGVRRLALRDALHQTPNGKSPSPLPRQHTTYVDSSNGCFTELIGYFSPKHDGSPYYLYKFLYNNPTLALELYDEFYFFLQHDPSPHGFHHAPRESLPHRDSQPLPGQPSSPSRQVLSLLLGRSLPP